MSALNICVLVALLLGALALGVGATRAKSSGFDDGSFLVQITLIAIGAGLVVVALLTKFVASLFG
jgi:hypothetical protein